MPLSGGRLAFERAIRRSGLPAPARHVALTIATWADVGTGAIPDRFQPSISTLAEATGLSEATVKRHLGVLEVEGWLLRDRPEISKARREHARTKYALVLPDAALGHGSERAMPGLTVSHAMGQPEPRHGSEEAQAGLRVSHKSSLNPDESPRSTTSSPAEPADTEPAVEPDVTDGGGGGVSDLRSIAEHITANLDYCDQVPDKQQLQALTAALVAVLEKGWTVEVLAPYLRLGSYRPGNPVAFYLAKLTKNLPDTVPTPPSPVRGGVRGDMPSAADYESLTVDDVLGDGRRDAADGGMWERAMARAQGGTDGTVAAWMDLSRNLAKQGHQPYSNPQDDSVYDEPWPLSTADRRAAQGLALAAKYRAEEERSARPSWCGEPECEPIGRMREYVDASGLKRDVPCPRCHPDRARAA